MTLVPASELLPPTCGAVELHPDPLDECHPLEHPAIKHPVTPVVCPAYQALSQKNHAYTVY